MSLKNYKFIKDLKKEYMDIVMQTYPELDEDKVEKFVMKTIENTLKSPKAEIHNNYIHKSFEVDLLKVIDWFNERKPIAGGFGVFFQNQNESLNPVAKMLENFLALRKQYKSFLKKYSKDSYDYGTYDRLQGNEKVSANSYYGASGAPTSNFFNLYTATSVTATGQSLISTTELAFEAFLANNVSFHDLDDCLVFMNNVIKEKKTIDDDFLPNISKTKLFKRLRSTFKEYDEEYNETLIEFISNLSKKETNRIYFKNNIFEFFKVPKILNKLNKIFLNVKEFKNPNDVPESIQEPLEEVWEYCREFVFYNHFYYNRIERLKKDPRDRVVVIDTDSNMLNLNPWVKFSFNNIISVNDKLLKRDPEELRYISINIMCYIITNMITEVLMRYTKGAHIPKEYRGKINMKNEYLFTRLILSSKKKRYISSIRLREGEEILPESIDIKGLDFMKSSTREETKKYFTDLVKEKLLYVDKINLSEILQELERFENIIKDSLQKGEKNFLIPKSVKELEAYKDPFKEQGIRSIVAWNYLYPDSPINLPDKVDMIKVKLATEDEVEKLKELEPKYYKIIKKNIFGNKEQKIASKGVQVIALPRSVSRIPDWLLPFIDYETIVNDNISRFYSVLESLGIETIRASKKEYFSNIIKI